MENWTGKPVYLKIKTKIHEQLGSLHFISSVYNIKPPNEGEVVAIFKNAFVVNIYGTSRLPPQIWLTAMTSMVIEQPFQQLGYRLAKLLQAAIFIEQVGQ